MIPFQFHLERNHGKYREDRQCNHFLNHFQLHDIERSAAVLETQSVGRHLQTIFKKAMAQLNAITPMSGSAANPLNSSRIFKCPYQANVMKMFEKSVKR